MKFNPEGSTVRNLNIIKAASIPQSVGPDTVIFLERENRGESYYFERTDRNIGWVTREEQAMLRESTISIAGTGGMGGQVSQILVRLGIGKIRIADPEVFDISNLNRQLGASRDTIGKSKALETARVLRRITDDFDLEVFPQGICDEILPYFIPDTDLIIDEIEFWNIGACIRMHQYARRLGVSILNCLTVGFATYLHFFTPDSMPVENMLGLSLEDADRMENALLTGTLSPYDQRRLMERIFECFIPDMPKYFRESYLNIAVTDRLANEGKAPIIATNPAMASGFVANRTLLHLLQQKSPVRRDVSQIPTSPGYVVIDAATLSFSSVSR